eukprot:symbB.v1.2.020537.t1/scaffold1725.1/size121579/2
MALRVLREFYGGTAKASENKGTATGIIGMLEVVESDFAKNLAQMRVSESTAEGDFKKELQDMKLEKTRKEKDMKYKIQASQRLEADLQELQSDTENTKTELSAIEEFNNGLTAECTVPPESFKEKQAKRQEEIQGLKTALEALDSQGSLLQSKKTAFRWWLFGISEPSTGLKPSIDLVELPRLSVNFKSLRKDGELRLYCVDHGDLFLPNGPPTALRSEAARLLSPLPHVTWLGWLPTGEALLLQTENSEFHILCPNVKVFRPVIDSDPFSTELVFARADFKWNKNARNKSFLYPVHPTLSFLQTPTQNSALYLLLMQWLHRNHGEAAALVNSISTDDRLDAGEAQIFEQLGIIGDADADTCAIRLQITLAMCNAPGLEWPWENCGQVQGYLKKLSHVSARCRLSLAEEIRVLRICSDERKRRDLVRAEVKAMKRQFWGYYGKVKLQRYHKMLTDAVAALEASAQDHRELQEWLKHIRKKVRAAQLPGGREEVKEVAGPKESKWQCHLDQNVLMCSLFDLLFEVLGAELLLREDVGEDSEGAKFQILAPTLCYTPSSHGVSL